MPIRSMVGLLPLCAVEVLDQRDDRSACPGFKKRLEWFLTNRPDLAPAHHLHGARRITTASAAAARDLRHASGCSACCGTCWTRTSSSRRSASAPSRASTSRIRSSCASTATSIVWTTARANRRPALFGGNSNWRGPIWLPMNFLLVEALERYHHFYGDRFHRRVPDRIGAASHARAGRARALAPGGVDLPARRRQAVVPAMGTTPLCRRSALARPDAVPRVLSRRDRPRLRRQPSDGMDRAGRAFHRRLGPKPGWEMNLPYTHRHAKAAVDARARRARGESRHPPGARLGPDKAASAEDAPALRLRLRDAHRDRRRRGALSRHPGGGGRDAHAGAVLTSSRIRAAR